MSSSAMRPTATSATPSTITQRAPNSWSASSMSEGDGQVPAVGGAAHHVLARQAHQRVGDVRRLQVHRRGQRPGRQRLVQRHLPGEHPRPHRGVGLLLANALQPAEPAAEVGERRALVPGGDGDVREEHGVRAPGDGLRDPALQVRQRAAQHRDALDALLERRARELVALARELVGEVLLAVGEDVHAEVARLEDGGLRRAGLVEADQHHRRFERQRAHRARGGAERGAVDARGDDRDAAREPPDDVAELLLVGERHGRASVPITRSRRPRAGPPRRRP